MSTLDSLKAAFDITDMVVQSYLGDMEDADLLTRPGAGCNHIAWQLGHVISSEANMINMLQENAAIDLPAGFGDQHGKDMATEDDPAKFCSKSEYMDLYQKTRENTLAVLNGLSEEQLQAEAPEQFRAFCPTVASMAMLMATHPMMHAGQFVPVRRSLGKPIVI